MELSVVFLRGLGVSTAISGIGVSLQRPPCHFCADMFLQDALEVGSFHWPALLF